MRHVVRDARRLEPVSVRVGEGVYASLPAQISAHENRTPLMLELEQLASERRFGRELGGAAQGKPSGSRSEQFR